VVDGLGGSERESEAGDHGAPRRAVTLPGALRSVKDGRGSTPWCLRIKSKRVCLLALRRLQRDNTRIESYLRESNGAFYGQLRIA